MTQEITKSNSINSNSEEVNALLLIINKTVDVDKDQLKAISEILRDEMQICLSSAIDDVFGFDSYDPYAIPVPIECQGYNCGTMLIPTEFFKDAFRNSDDVKHGGRSGKNNTMIGIKARELVKSVASKMVGNKLKCSGVLEIN